MRKSLALLLSAAALAMPTVGAAAIALHALKTKVVTRKVTGQTFQANQWGAVVVNLTVRTTTVAGSTKMTRRYTDLGGSYTYHTNRSQYIMSQSLPMLRQEFLTAQSPNIQVVSGATYTSQAFEQSVRSALAKLTG
jgi:major membrane immunogen (membrane-anchored lipoprotein)